VSIEQTFIQGWGGQNGANPVTVATVVSADAEDNRSISLPAGDEVTVSLDLVEAQLKGLYIQSAGAFKLVVGPNGSSPEEFTPEMGVPIEWLAASGMYYPFLQTSVSEIQLVSLDEESAQTVTIKTISDSTP